MVKDTESNNVGYYGRFWIIVAASWYVLQLLTPYTIMNHLIMKLLRWKQFQTHFKIIVLIKFQIESIKSSFNILKGREWKKTDDFLPLLVLDDEQIMKAKSFDLKCFPERVYKLSEALSVDNWWCFSFHFL